MGSCLSSEGKDDSTRSIQKRKSNGQSTVVQNTHYTRDTVAANQPKPPEENARRPSKVTIVEEKPAPEKKREKYQIKIIEEVKEIAPTIEELKEQSLKSKTEGNYFFKQKNYKSAIRCYTKAIELYDQDTTYYSNRAMCYRFEKEWNKAIKDSESSINLDPTNYKGYFLKAMSLVEFGKQKSDPKLLEQAISCFSQTLIIYQKKNGNQDDATTEDINTKLQKAKKIESLMIKEQNIETTDNIHSYLSNLIAKDNKSTSEQKKDALNVVDYCRTEKNKEYGKQNDIPDFYNCKISFELMKNPVVTPEGFAYERANIKEHLTKNGPTDPLSRNELYPGQLIENKALKQAIDVFKSENPWSFDYLQPNERFEDVLMS